MNRRRFLQMNSGSAASLALPAALGSTPSPPPNIVLVMADDMGYSDIGCYGSEIATSNIDRLARGGVRFTQFYNCARCCPTRSSLLTGLYPHQAGIGHMVENLGNPSYQGYLNDRCVTLAEVLGGAGYRTMMSGKWHVGEDRPHWPVDRGFQDYFGLISGASSYWQLESGRKMALGNQLYTPPASFYMTDAITDYALQFLDRSRRPQPFFLYLAYTSPHWPLHAHRSDIEKYEGKYRIGWDELRRRRLARMIELGIVDRRWPLTPRDTEAPAWETVQDKAARDRAMAVYAAQIDRLDQNIGRVLAKLEELRALENTLVLFLSDNGGCAEKVNRGQEGIPPGGPESYSSYGLPWANASNTPFRLYKHWVHEGGIATPLIAHWPAGIRQPGRLHPQAGHVADFMATFVDLARAKYPRRRNGQPITPMQGRSLAGAFAGRPAESRRLFWEHEGNRAMRDGKWKLVSRHPDRWELYDLEADRAEMNDLATARPELTASMTRSYEEWAGRCGVQPWGEVEALRKAVRKDPARE